MLLETLKTDQHSQSRNNEISAYQNLIFQAARCQSLRRSPEDTSLLEFKIVELLLAVHLDDKRNDEDKEGGSGDPSSIAGAFEEFLKHEGGVSVGLFAPGDDGGA